MHEEQIEKLRQAIMRYRELLDIAHARLAQAEKRYERLFAGLDDAQRALPEKQQQRAAALIALDDRSELQRALLQLQFDLRDLERAFEETYNHIAPED